MTPDIREWLTAQLDEEDQAVSLIPGGGYRLCPLPVQGAVGRSPGRDEHVVMWDPARAAAEVAAKRRILELHRRADAEPWWPAGAGPGAYCIGCGGSFQEEAMVPDANDCPVVRLLAAPYSGRPGWDPSWEVKE